MRENYLSPFFNAALVNISRRMHIIYPKDKWGMKMYMYYPYVRQQAGERRLMMVTGNGSVSVEPDIVTIELGIVTENKELGTAQAENAKITNQVIQSLIRLGIPTEKIQTGRYTIQPMYDFVDGKQVFRGYRVEHMLRVEIPSVDQAGIIIDIAVQNEVNQISNIQFSVENKEKYYRQALNIALEDALAKAESMATTLHLNLDAQPIRITEEEVHQPPIVYQAFAMAEAQPTTPIQAGQIVIHATVRVQFQYFS